LQECPRASSFSARGGNGCKALWQSSLRCHYWSGDDVWRVTLRVRGGLRDARRQRKLESGAFAGLASNRQMSALQFDEIAAQKQAQSASGFARGEFEQICELIGSHPEAGITDQNLDDVFSR
jgi:hypothetical protein